MEYGPTTRGRDRRSVLLIGQLNQAKDNPYMCECVRGLAGEFFKRGIDSYTAHWEDIRKGCECASVYNHASSSFMMDAAIGDFADVVILRQLGRIHQKMPLFERLLEDLKSCAVPVSNGPATMLDNLSKTYLLKLQECGIAVPRTEMVSPVSALPSLDSHVEAGNDLVIKPVYGGECGLGIHRIGELTPELAAKLEGRYGQMLLQEYIPEISEGEFSLVYVGGRFSHGVHKPLVEGFKVNEVPGKTFYRQYNPTEAEKDMGSAVIGCLGVDPDVMRLDIVHTRTGPKIMEVEMINPAIYEDVPVLGDIFAKNFCDHIEKKYLLRGA